jgi:acetyltransferase-like isoleucine patch superfamily enzyme
MNKFVRLFRYDWPMHFVLLITNWLPDNVVFVRLRGAMARPFFRKCGPKLGLGRNLVFYNPSQIEIGHHVYIAYGCWFNSTHGVSIEDEVIFGPQNIIATSNHTRLNGSFRFGECTGDRITFKKGSWLGANCTVLAGSTIGAGSVVAANTVVNGEVPDHVVFAGNPGEVKKRYPTE